MSDTKKRKPLGGKSYGSIPHLIGSRRGPMDIGVNEGQQRICCEKKRDRNDTIIVQEKIDGGNVSAALINGEVLALTRGGIMALDSTFEHHLLWADWVAKNEARFREVLNDGERICGEWLALAHGTIYNLPHEPFVAFDIMSGKTREPYANFTARLEGKFVIPKLLHIGDSLSVEKAMELLEPSGHGAVGLAEGAVWRVERFDHKQQKVVVDFLSKYVRPEKEDGRYLPMEAHPERKHIWLWRPE